MTVIACPERTEEFLRAVGDPGRVLFELAQVSRSAQVLSSEHPRLIDEYAGKWVALHDGRVIAEAETIDEVLARVDETDPASRNHVLVRFIDQQQHTLIL